MVFVSNVNLNSNNYLEHCQNPPCWHKAEQYTLSCDDPSCRIIGQKCGSKDEYTKRCLNKKCGARASPRAPPFIIFYVSGPFLFQLLGKNENAIKWIMYTLYNI